MDAGSSCVVRRVQHSVEMKPVDLSHGTFLSCMFVLGWLLLVPWWLWK